MRFGFIRDGVRRLFRFAPRSPERARADAEDEFRGYVVARVEQLVAAGWSPQDAHDEAVRRLGGDFDRALRDVVRSAQHREERLRFRDLVSDLRDDLRFALRGLRREPLVAGFIIVTLALGIGANAAMFGIADRLLLRGPDHVADADRVMRVYYSVQRPGRGRGTGQSFGWVTYDMLRQHAPGLSVAAYSVNTEGTTFGTGADATLVPFGAATWDMFSVLGVRPAAGRFFTAQEDSPTAPQRVAVLGYGLWQRAFGGDPGVVGTSASFGSANYTIVGVAPRGFTGPQLGPVDVWIPMSLRSTGVTNDWARSWNAQWLRVIARLKPGVTPEVASAQATSAWRAGYGGDEPAFKAATLSVRPLSANNRGDEAMEATVARWLLGVAAIVLLIACSNVANLLLARAVRRRREVAVRVALGAGRGRLVRLLLTESGLLAALGAAAGLAVAWATATLMRRTLLPNVEWTASPVNARVLAFSVAIAILVGLVTGLAPAVRIGRTDLTAALKAGAREGGGRTSTLRGFLTVSQAALSVILLVGAGLFLRSLANVNAVDLGIQPDRVLVVDARYATHPDFSAGERAERVRRREVLRQAVQRVRGDAAIENASLAVGLPFQSSFTLSVRVTGWDSVPELNGRTPSVAAVADGYFETVGTRLLDGRSFTAADREGSEPVAIVNRAMAETLWPGKSPIGLCVYSGESIRDLKTCSRVVGVVADQHSGLREPSLMQYYVPFGQETGIGGTVLLVRPQPGRESAAIAAARRTLLALDPGITFARIISLQDEVAPQIRPWRLGATVFALMGALALIVAALGLYSVLSYLVAQRTREIGVRMALGAQAASIAALILRSGALMTLVGIAIGAAAALMAGRFIAPLLFDVSPRDPLVFGSVATMLLAVAVLAGLVPASRARRVDPMEALRSD